MTMAALTEYPELFAAGANLFGILNFATFFSHCATISMIEYGDLKTWNDLLEPAHDGSVQIPGVRPGMASAHLRDCERTSTRFPGNPGNQPGLSDRNSAMGRAAVDRTPGISGRGRGCPA
jgi:hypothetical protein